MNDVVVSVPLPVSLVRPGRLGDPMLFAATDIRARMSIGRESTSKKYGQVLQKAIDALKQKYPDIQQKWGMTVQGSMPDTVGATVAIFVGAIGGLLYAHRKVWNPLAIQEIAYGSIKDSYEEAPAMVAASVAGGIIWSRRELPFLTSTWQLPIKLPREFQKFSLSFVRTQEAVAKSSAKAIAVALKQRDERALRRYYRGGVVSLPGDTVLWYGVGEAHQSRMIEIGGDGIRLESK